MPFDEAPATVRFGRWPASCGQPLEPSMPCADVTAFPPPPLTRHARQGPRPLRIRLSAVGAVIDFGKRDRIELS